MKDRSIVVRRAAPDDATRIAEVLVASWQTTYPGIVDQDYVDRLDVSNATSRWSQRLSSIDSSAPDIFVASTADGGIVGFLSGGLIREPYPGFDAELHAIYLLQQYQRIGIGQRLTREWAAAAVDRGLHAAVVRVLARNPACSFYERLGAAHLHDAQLVIGEKPYPERWYGWPDLRVLAHEDG